ncbi:unnamed protein product [Bursaphelenchus okinawaensis]|uniref:Homeobox domain-containing protein n=1 Tax=Bursaphelenchus okinawaensis TaxID=465554 RepID=A0A811JRH6_9BILA|nr:unnamed protein product [Bursaphelenchus okinawaensis]CAG9079838.1 unnamed protein product [Bursaphelenchus okinawaensis]
MRVQRYHGDEDLEFFSLDFKRKRLEYGYSQSDVGLSIGRRFGMSLSQTTVSRFEAYNLSMKNMLKLKPIFESWIAQAGEAFKRGIPASRFLKADIIAGQENHFNASNINGNNLNMNDANQVNMKNINLTDTNMSNINGNHVAMNNISPNQPIMSNINGSSIDMSHINGNQLDMENINLKMSQVNQLQDFQFAPPFHFEFFNYPDVNYEVVPNVFVAGDPIYVGKRRRKRTVITEAQRYVLKREFKENQNPCLMTIDRVVKETGLEPFVVRVWFANRRQKYKRERMLSMSDDRSDVDYDLFSEPPSLSRLKEEPETFTKEEHDYKNELTESPESCMPTVPQYYQPEVPDQYVPNDQTLFGNDSYYQKTSTYPTYFTNTGGYYFTYL